MLARGEERMTSKDRLDSKAEAVKLRKWWVVSTTVTAGATARPTNQEPVAAKVVCLAPRLVPLG